MIYVIAGDPRYLLDLVATTVKFVIDLSHEITIPSIEVRHIKNY